MSDHPYLDNTNADIRLLGNPNLLNGFSQFNSSPRVNMFNHHLAQAMIIKEPEFNKLFTGIEHNYLQYSLSDSKREFPCEILATIPKYRGPLVHRDNCPEVYVICLTIEPGGVRRLDYFVVSQYFMGNNNFGWLSEIKNTNRLQAGEILDKDTPITHSPAIIGDKYCLGRNVNVVYGSFPETVEDSFIISESLAKSLETTQISKLDINCRADRRPLNINGNKDEDKFLPDIGSFVRDDGLLCAWRPTHWSTIVADSDPQALREFLPLQDDPSFYVEPGAKIIDLTFNANFNRLNNLYPQVKEYIQNNNKFWEDIYKFYTTYRGKVKLTPKMTSLVRSAIYRLLAQGANIPSLDAEFRKLARNYEIEGIGSSNQYIDFLQVEVIYTVPRIVSAGSKLTDSAGSKGVVGRVYPDDWMPVDDYGFRADLWIDMTSPVARNNPGQLYECGINRINEFVRRKVETIYKVQGPEPAFETLMDWYGDVNSNYEKRLREICYQKEHRAGIVKDAIETSPIIWIPPFLQTLTPSDEDFWNALENIRKWAKKWGVKGSPITYKTLQPDGSGKEFRTEVEFNIGSKYVYHLHKIPEIFAPGPASVNHMGIPVKSNSENKHFPVSINPYRYGEDELRIIAMESNIREVVRLINMLSNSPKGVNTAIESILLADHPSAIKRIPISNGDLLKSSVIAKLFHNITATLGVETKNTNNQEYIDKVKEAMKGLNVNILEDSIYNTDFEMPKRDKEESDSENSPSLKRSETKRHKMQKMLDSIEDDIEETEEEADVESILDELKEEAGVEDEEE